MKISQQNLTIFTSLYLKNKVSKLDKVSLNFYFLFAPLNWNPTAIHGLHEILTKHDSRCLTYKCFRFVHVTLKSLCNIILIGAICVLKDFRLWIFHDFTALMPIPKVLVLRIWHLLISVIFDLKKGKKGTKTMALLMILYLEKSFLSVF